MDIEETDFFTDTLADLLIAFTAAPAGPGPGGRETFVTMCPERFPGERVFGGMVVAQALNAATQTAPEGFEIHSMHGYFLRPSRGGVPSTHTVDRVREGRSFSTREVVTEQEGKAVFRMTCSFHAPEVGEEYQQPLESGLPLPAAVRGYATPSAFDIREIGATQQREDGSFLSTRRYWFKVSEPLPNNPMLHACVLAYVSDKTGAAFRPRTMDTWGQHTDASLDHALWFHRPWRTDQWSLYDLQALVNAGGRATIRATMHGEDGLLHMSMAQELLIRELDEPVQFDESVMEERRRRRDRQRAGIRTGEASDGTA